MGSHEEVNNPQPAKAVVQVSQIPNILVNMDVSFC